MDPRVSIVVLTHDRCGEVCRTLERLLSLRERYAVIVVDNGSTDGTPQRIAAQFPGVTMLRAGRNLGAAGRNLGVERVMTPYVAFCDDDTWWRDGALQAAADLLDARPELAVLNARILVGPEERLDPACALMAQSPLGRIEGVGPRLAGFMAGANVMRTCEFRDAGGYWPPFFIGGEESLLALDILDAGGDIAYAPALEVVHWPSPRRDPGLRRRMLARNALWTAWLRLPAIAALRRTAACLAELPNLRSRTVAVCDALGGWRLVWRHRRSVRPQTCRLLEQVWRHERALNPGRAKD
jgi:GT2 family glycosyltransferase